MYIPQDQQKDWSNVVEIDLLLGNWYCSKEHGHETRAENIPSRMLFQFPSISRAQPPPGYDRLLISAGK